MTQLLFVMEVKSNRLHVNVLEESNATGLEDFLKQNFANEKEAGAKKNKGVFQLIRQLETLANSRKTRNVSVYPIIVYTEPVMDISGVNFYLQSLMKDRLAPLKENFKRILPLTCINVDFFIRFYNELKGDRFFLKNAIIKFHKRMESNRKSYKKSQKPLTYFNSNFSFMRMCEEDAPLDDVMKYFNAAAQDLGFGEAATLH